MSTAIGFDIGTTHLKWQLRDRDTGVLLQHGVHPVPPDTRATRSEQAVAPILQAVQEVIAQASQQGDLSQVAFSGAMHSLIAVDAKGLPRTESLTWMDNRAAPLVAQLRQQGLHDMFRKATGVPLHPMVPWVKWLWLKPHLPPEARPVALKDYIIHALTGEWVEDYSTAAASGFLGLDAQWHPELLAMAQLTADSLPALKDMVDSLPCRAGDYRVVIGANDAASQHWHFGLEPGSPRAVISLGTSGALRTTAATPVSAPDLFCYSLGPHRGFLVGAAFSNAGNVLQWLANVTNLPVPTLLEEAIQSLRRGTPLPFAVPYWYGERFPWWRTDLRGAWHDLAPEHGRAELAGALLLAMAAGYWHALQRLEESGLTILDLVGASGLLDLEPLAQFLADALNRPLTVYPGVDASLAGAVDLAMGGVGRVMAPSSINGRRHHPQDRTLPERVEAYWHRLAQTIRDQQS
ncbi:MAG: FGGY family carbohydrate kinase [Firmicutes bacterium]|nr:FGGY family carbohydrate kinase [Bacillota bacterium]